LLLLNGVLELGLGENAVLEKHDTHVSGIGRQPNLLRADLQARDRVAPTGSMVFRSAQGPP